MADAKTCRFEAAPHWTVFSQIRTQDHDTLPAVLTRQQIHDLLGRIRLRRYRTPLKLIYVCGLRLSECLGLTIHDICGKENKLLIRNSKGHQDRVLPLPTSLYHELRRYWKFHRHPLLIFPNVGRGDTDPQAVAQRIGVLRRFLPEFLKRAPALSKEQRRGIWAITHCRTPALGGRAFGCQPCGTIHFAYHSCNHKACPQCGAQATRRWVHRELGKLVNAPYFLVTFTLPSELRGCFFGPLDSLKSDLCVFD